jgi:hypothetical protein
MPYDTCASSGVNAMRALANEAVFSDGDCELRWPGGPFLRGDEPGEWMDGW